MSPDATLLEPYRQALIGRKVSHVWRGYGSALFLEFGELSPRGFRKDGSPRNPTGEVTAMVEWSWRIERRSVILCGSSSEELIWAPNFDRLIGAEVADVSTFGRLPELLISLTGELYVASFMTAEGHPAWALIDRSPERRRAIHVRSGAIVEEELPAA
jgi:hypothetical protein